VSKIYLLALFQMSGPTSGHVSRSRLGSQHPWAAQRDGDPL